MKKIIIAILMFVTIMTMTGCSAGVKDSVDEFDLYSDLSRIEYFADDDLRLYWRDENEVVVKTMTISRDHIDHVKNGRQDDGKCWIKVWMK